MLCFTQPNKPKSYPLMYDILLVSCYAFSHSFLHTHTHITTLSLCTTLLPLPNSSGATLVLKNIYNQLPEPKIRYPIRNFDFLNCNIENFMQVCETIFLGGYWFGYILNVLRLRVPENWNFFKLLTFKNFSFPNVGRKGLPLNIKHRNQLLEEYPRTLKATTRVTNNTVSYTHLTLPTNREV